MEKNYSNLYKIPYQKFISRIVIGVRGKATTIEGLAKTRNGAIRITMVPLSSLAEAWLGGGLSDFGEHPENVPDSCEREFVYKLFPDGSHTMQFECDDHTEPVNCYGYSALKVAYASWKRKFDEWVSNNGIPKSLKDHEFQKQTQFFVTDNGYSMDRGVVLTTIKLDGKPFMRLYVTVSGAQTGETDERCALAGMLKGQIFLTEINENVEFSLDERLNFSFTPDFIQIG